MMFAKCACILIVLLSRQADADFVPSSYCELVRENFSFADIESCDNYYTCVKGQAIKMSCSPNMVYNKNTQSCVAATQVACSLKESPCLNTKNVAFKPIPDNCQGFIYCKDGRELGRGQCPNDLNFINGVCTYEDCPNTGTGTGSGSGNEATQLVSLCDIMPINVYFGDFADCQSHQICSAGSDVPIKGKCNAPYFYDTKIEKCVYGSAVTCDSRVNSTVASGNCVAGDKTFDANNCARYYECSTELTYVQKECPSDSYYDIKMKKCTLRQIAVPYHLCDRCLGSTATFVNAVSPDCNQYIYCRNGKKAAIDKCKDGSYFNEDMGACMNDERNKAAYVGENGACAACKCQFNGDGVCQEADGRADCVCEDKC